MLINVFLGVLLPLSSFLIIIIYIFTDLFCSLFLIIEKEDFNLLTLRPRNYKKNYLITIYVYL